MESFVPEQGGVIGIARNVVFDWPSSKIVYVQFEEWEVAMTCSPDCSVDGASSHKDGKGSPNFDDHTAPTNLPRRRR